MDEAYKHVYPRNNEARSSQELVQLIRAYNGLGYCFLAWIVSFCAYIISLAYETRPPYYLPPLMATIYCATFLFGLKYFLLIGRIYALHPIVSALLCILAMPIGFISTILLAFKLSADIESFGIPHRLGSFDAKAAKKRVRELQEREAQRATFDVSN